MTLNHRVEGSSPSGRTFKKLQFIYEIILRAEGGAATNLLKTCCTILTTYRVSWKIVFNILYVLSNVCHRIIMRRFQTFVRGVQLSIRQIQCAIVLLGLVSLFSPEMAHAASDFNLGTASFLEGASGGTGYVIVTGSGVWTASANDLWLHTTASGNGNGVAVFFFEDTAGATRSGTLTIGGQTLTVTQAGSTYVAANPSIPLVSTGLSGPAGIAVDRSGNLYIADTYNNAVKKVDAVTHQVTTLVDSGLNQPEHVAVDTDGNVYIADYGNDSIQKWSATTQSTTTVVSGLNGPSGVAVDGSGNIYIADTFSDSVKKWTAATQSVTTLIGSGLSSPMDVAVDASGDLHIADYGNNAIKKWTMSAQTLSTEATGWGVFRPLSVTVDGAGTLYIQSGNEILKWTRQGPPAPSVGPGISAAVDGAGNVYLANNDVINEIPYAFVDTSEQDEPMSAGTASLPPVLPLSLSLSGLLAPSSDQTWLTPGPTSTSVANFSFTANTGATFRIANVTVLGQKILVAQAPGAPFYLLGTTSILEGPSAATDAVLLSSNAAWTATSGASWLHVDPASSSGSGSAAIVFGVDANPGPTRTGAVNIGGQILTVNQAGSSYVPANQVALLTGTLAYPTSVAVDGSGNAYLAEVGDNSIWIRTPSGSLSTVVANISPTGLAVDLSANLYFADSRAIKKYTAVTRSVSTLVGAGLSDPHGVAVDVNGNVYFADSNAIKKWSVVTQTAKILVGSGLNQPEDVAVDVSGNVYIADTGNNAIKKWTAATQDVTTLVGQGLHYPRGLVVDSSGNVYIADTGNMAVKKWNAISQTVTTLVGSGLLTLTDVAVDATGNVYIADPQSTHASVKEMPRAFIDTTAISAPATAGSGALPTVLPLTENLLPPFAPTSNQSWLSFGPTLNGVVNYSFAPNPGASRTATISLLGRTIAVTQDAAPTYLSKQQVTEQEASGGMDSVLLTTNAAWTAVSNDPWLHVDAANSNGSGNASIAFTFDANPGADRTGTLTIAGLTLTVTQAAPYYILNSATERVAPYAQQAGTSLFSNAAWTATSNAPWLHVNAGYSSGTGSSPIYFSIDANAGPMRTGTLTIGGQTLTITQVAAYSLGTETLIEGPGAGIDTVLIAADAGWFAWSNDSWLHVVNGISTGNGSAPVPFTFDANPGATRTGSLTIGGQTLTVIQAGSGYVRANPVTTLVNGLNFPFGIAVDDFGNVYIADTENQAIKKWNAATQTESVLVDAGLYYPLTLAVDGSGNVYIVDDDGLKMWSPTNGLTTLADPATGLYGTSAVAVDRQGNVYLVADDLAGMALYKWNANDGLATLTDLPSIYEYLAIDAAGQFYLADAVNNTIEMWTPEQGLTTVVGAGLSNIDGVAVDCSGNVYISDNATIKKWTASTQSLTTLIDIGGVYPDAVAVDHFGNVYFTDFVNGVTQEYTYALVDATPRTEPVPAGADSLSVLPTTQSLNGIFAPASDQPWLTLGTVSNGVVNFAFSRNNDPADRTANITVLGQQVPVTQVHDAVHHFLLTWAPSEMNGAAFTGINTLTAVDAAGNKITNFDASLNPVTLSVNAPLTGQISGLGTAHNNVLNKSSDFVNGVANITQLKAIYTGNAATGIFAATSTTGKTGVSGNVIINAGAIDHFLFNLSPAETEGLRFTGINTLTAKDSQNNIITNFNAQRTPVFLRVDAPLSGNLLILGEFSFPSELNRSTDFVNGVADLTAIGTFYFGAVGTGTFTAQINSSSGPFLVDAGTSGSVVINRQSQTIAVDPLSNQTYGAAPITLTATATSQLPVSYVVLAGPASLDGSTLTILGAGNITVQATQDGNINWVDPAPPVTVSFTVHPAPLSISANDATSVFNASIPAFSATFDGFVNGDDEGSLTGVLSLSTPATPGSSVGGYAIVPSGLSGANYAITFNAGMLAITPASATVTLDSSNVIFDGTSKTVTPVTNPAGLGITVTYNGSPVPPTNAGSYAVVASINDANYTGGASGTLVVNKATPPIVWAIPDAIVSGTPLSATQLNAKSNVPGTFVYDPPFGAVLSAGSKTLTVLFTPTDHTNYKANTATVTILVSNAPPVFSSPPTATPTATTVGNPIHFIAAATDADGDALTYSWNFGDGSTGAGADATHTYATANVYQAVVTVTDVALGTTSGSVTVTINAIGGSSGATPPGTIFSPFTISNADGIPDQMQGAAAQIGLPSVSSPQTLTDVDLAIRLNFAHAGSDALVLSGTLPLHAGITANGQSVIVDVGGVVKIFTLNAQGKSKIGNDLFTLALNRKPTSNVKFAMKLSKGTFQSTLMLAGLNNATSKAKQVTIPIGVILTDQIWVDNREQTYTATQGRLGVTKNLK